MSKLSFSLLSKSLLTSVSAAVLLTACGGGGGGADPSAANQTMSTSSTTGAAGAGSAASTSGTSVTAVDGATVAPVAQAATPGPFGQDASQFELSFSDEFENGYNSAVWNDTVWYEQPNPTQNYAVEDGKLKIWPQRDASGRFFNRTIDTDGKYYQTYGYFEIEAKLPYGKGAWPAFWLLNHDDPHPIRPEIDILEAYSGGGPNSGWSDANLRPTAFASTVWPTGTDHAPNGGHKMLVNLPDLSAGYHKYAVKWEPNKITFYFDGQEFYSTNVSMDKRMYILLDLWYGSASGTPDDSTPQGKNNSFEVNYVRAWQLKK